MKVKLSFLTVQNICKHKKCKDPKYKLDGKFNEKQKYCTNRRNEYCDCTERSCPILKGKPKERKE